ncbi:Fosmidomycin resistance protein [Mannheimia haemolytica]
MVLPILLLISLSHLLNDLVQAVMVSILSNAKRKLPTEFCSNWYDFTHLSNYRIYYSAGYWALYRYPKPNLLPVSMLITLLSVILLAFSPNFGVLLIAAALMGIGSAIFHPRASRVARMASGGKKFGTAQSLFQVGGNSGSALGRS